MIFQKGEKLSANKMNQLASGRLSAPGTVQSGTKTYQRRMGRVSNGDSTDRWAFCKNDAGSGSTITCYLDTDGTGEEVTVHFEIDSGTAMNTAAPRLRDGTKIRVSLYGDEWWCTQVFSKTRVGVC